MNISVDVPELNRTVTMEDICFQPLAPDNNNCTIQRWVGRGGTGWWPGAGGFGWSGVKWSWVGEGWVG